MTPYKEQLRLLNEAVAGNIEPVLCNDPWYSWYLRHQFDGGGLGYRDYPSAPNCRCSLSLIKDRRKEDDVEPGQ